MSLPHIAVLDDEPDITQLLANYLQSQGFRVTQLSTGRTLLDLMPADPPQLVLLDLGLPGEDGFAIARQLREHWRCGLVIVTGRGDAVDKVVGLEVGADDYVTKPFDLRELLARIKAVLRRIEPAPVPAGAPAASNGTQRLRFGQWELDLAARRLSDGAGRSSTARSCANAGALHSKHESSTSARSSICSPYTVVWAWDGSGVGLGAPREKERTQARPPRPLEAYFAVGFGRRRRARGADLLAGPPLRMGRPARRQHAARRDRGR